jgi:hypothetical protein
LPRAHRYGHWNEPKIGFIPWRCRRAQRKNRVATTP